MKKIVTVVYIMLGIASNVRIVYDGMNVKYPQRQANTKYKA